MEVDLDWLDGVEYGFDIFDEDIGVWQKYCFLFRKEADEDWFAFVIEDDSHKGPQHNWIEVLDGTKCEWHYSGIGTYLRSHKPGFLLESVMDWLDHIIIPNSWGKDISDYNWRFYKEVMNGKKFN